MASGQASGQLSRAEALECSGYRHACHVMLYADTKSQLFGKFPIKHIILVRNREKLLLDWSVDEISSCTSMQRRVKSCTPLSLMFLPVHIKTHSSSSLLLLYVCVCVRVYMFISFCVCGCIGVWVCNSLCHFPQMQMRYDGLLGFPGGWVFAGAVLFCAFMHTGWFSSGL